MQASEAELAVVGAHVPAFSIGREDALGPLLDACVLSNHPPEREVASHEDADFGI